MASWRDRSPVELRCEKRPATGSAGMVVTNHPLASAAGASILAAGGNAVDAAVGALFALTVAEPMMVGLLGGGQFHHRQPDGTHAVLDGMSTAPAAAHDGMFRPQAGVPDTELVSEARANDLGAGAVAVPGNLRAWCDALQRWGRLPLAEVVQPAIDLAARGFRVTPYLADCVKDAAPDMAQDPALARLFLPGGTPIAAGDRLVQADAAETLRLVARDGAAALHGGALGARVAEAIGQGGGTLALRDLAEYQAIERAVIRAPYRGWEVIGPPPPAASGVHIAQMLRILEGFDVAALGFGTADGAHLLAEVMKIAFADRAAATADPAFVRVPVARLVSAEYAAERRAAIDMRRAQRWSAGVSPGESANTTHVTVADADGGVVAATHTINSLFGARIAVPGTGLIPNNYMRNFDPRPGRAQSVAPGKRIPTSMAPMMVARDGRLRFALGLPGGLRIFPSAFQALVNLLDHGMTPQEAVEAPRLWTEGGPLEIEPAIPEPVQQALRDRGHALLPVPHVGGGMNAIGFADDGTMTGAACWRADGTAVGLGGGRARANVRFWPDQARPTAG